MGEPSMFELGRLLKDLEHRVEEVENTLRAHDRDLSSPSILSLIAEDEDED